MAQHPGGGFVLVVGPSGAGKDTLIGLARQALAGEPRVLFPRRVVTRASSAAEAHDCLSSEAFDAAVASGAFCLWWRAHGLAYGIPQTAALAAHEGAVVICNVSRTVIAEARQRLSSVTVVQITASPEILAQRLVERGRTEDGDLLQRLTRRVERDDLPPDVVITNDTLPEVAAGQLLLHLQERLADWQPVLQETCTTGHGPANRSAWTASSSDTLTKEERVR
jgi:ribose 1,5-bisphosphokinase